MVLKGERCEVELWGCGKEVSVVGGDSIEVGCVEFEGMMSGEKMKEVRGGWWRVGEKSVGVVGEGGKRGVVGRRSRVEKWKK